MQIYSAEECCTLFSHAGFDCVSVLANHARLGPLRCGLCWDAAAVAFTPDPLLRCLEPPVAGDWIDIADITCVSILRFLYQLLRCVDSHTAVAGKIATSNMRCPKHCWGLTATTARLFRFAAKFTRKCADRLGRLPDLSVTKNFHECTAELLELRKLPGGGKGAAYAPSRNRQSHLWAFSERADARSIALKRVFLR